MDKGQSPTFLEMILKMKQLRQNKLGNERCRIIIVEVLYFLSDAKSFMN